MSVKGQTAPLKSAVASQLVFSRASGSQEVSMMKKVLFLLALLSLLFFASSASLAILYVMPEDGNCSINGLAYKPCYSLHQLINEKVLSSLDESSLTLFLLSGTHLIPENETLNVSGFDQVAILPLTNEEEAVIRCKDAEKRDGHVLLNDNSDVKMSSLHFTSCLLKYRYEVERGFERSVNITKCVFEGSLFDFAISIWSTESRVKKVNVSNCTFLSNTGAITILTRQRNPYIVADLLITNTLFQSNQNNQCGGALNIDRTNLLVNNSRFIGNYAECGGSIASDSSSVKFVDAEFRNNQASKDGSVLFITGFSTIDFEKCHFVNNTAGRSAVIYAFNTALQRISNCTFQGNSAKQYGGVLYMENSGVTIIHCQFFNNSAQQGGVLYAIHNVHDSKINSSSFVLNRAENDGGVVYCKEDSSMYIYFDKGYSTSNSAGSAGGFAYSSNCLIVVSGHNISRNQAPNGGAVYAEQESVVVISHSTVANNTAGNSGAALHLTSSQVTVNQGIFDHNMATENGGAIFVQDNNCNTVSYPSRCFLSIVEKDIIFTNNTAAQGPVLYGGLLDRCCLDYDVCQKPGIDFIKNHSLHNANPLTITSDPVMVCLCDEKLEANCSLRDVTVSKMRGQTIDLKGIIVDQASNPKTSYVLARYSGFIAELGEGESRGISDGRCTNLSYHVFTEKSSALLVLEPEGPCEHSNFSSVTVHITIVRCSRGFEKDSDRCVCDGRLTKFFEDVVCDVDTESILINDHSGAWLHYGELYLRVHISCPLDYCRVMRSVIDLRSQDEQCANNRSGVVCGTCQDKFSIGLGSSKCLECTSSYAFVWLIPLFAVAGIALVALLLVCNMTISHGTLNGLIFYANVVSIAKLTRFQDCSINPALSVFVAWINLDFGIETCFYSGMDTYHQTWLQFAFPLYIWLIVGAIILASHFSLRAVKVFGKNNIAVLATLFLLSYTKVLKIIITALNFTEVFQGSANDTSDLLVPYKVWTHNGNIEYLKGKHVPLFVVALVLLACLFLPYTFLLTFGQCIRSMRRPRRLVLRCIRSATFVSIMDAYHAPYTNKHRYWTGLMLLIRCVLFLSFASSYNDNRLMSNMYTTTVVLMLVLGFRCCILKVYKKIGVNLLELSFLLNLGILSATLNYLRGNNSSDGALCKCISASISISMVTFTGIMIYHIYLKVKATKCFKPFEVFFLAMRHTGHKYDRITPADENLPTESQQDFPTSTTVELREELLDVDADQ